MSPENVRPKEAAALPVVRCLHVVFCRRILIYGSIQSAAVSAQLQKSRSCGGRIANPFGQSDLPPNLSDGERDVLASAEADRTWFCHWFDEAWRGGGLASIPPMASLKWPVPDVSLLGRRERTLRCRSSGPLKLRVASRRIRFRGEGNGCRGSMGRIYDASVGGGQSSGKQPTGLPSDPPHTGTGYAPRDVCAAELSSGVRCDSPVLRKETLRAAQ